ncbi:hypothetical protein BgAZ_109050 [Babesia gibsoni]|uniref:Uncharacterized protein n=1 Tax=Babesia gibsoni TaxID=33632 RepID=A0AAD8PGM6_BABGI|nr:hypothetical protein BgAZ_109050 [Babesia gibsoni]
MLISAILAVSKWQLVIVVGITYPGCAVSVNQWRTQIALRQSNGHPASVNRYTSVNPETSHNNKGRWKDTYISPFRQLQYASLIQGDLPPLRNAKHRNAFNGEFYPIPRLKLHDYRYAPVCFLSAFIRGHQHGNSSHSDKQVNKGLQSALFIKLDDEEGADDDMDDDDEQDEDDGWMLLDDGKRRISRKRINEIIEGVKATARRHRGRERKSSKIAIEEPDDVDSDLLDTDESETAELSRSLRFRTEGTNVKQEVESYEDLYATIEAMGDSKKKGDRDIHKFLKKKLKEVEELAKEARHTDGEEEEYTVEDFLEAFTDPTVIREDPTTVSYIFHRYLWQLKEYNRKNAFKVNPPKKAVTRDVYERIMRHVDQEENCGYRYPIEGTPDERYSDPNAYKRWGRTEMHTTEFLNRPRRTFGKVEENEETLEDMIASHSTVKHERQIQKELEDIKNKKLVADMSAINNLSATLSPEKESVVAETFTATVDWKDNIIKKDFLTIERNRQLQLLLALNPYNPWDEYRHMKMTKGRSNYEKPIPVTYKLKSIRIGMNVYGTTQNEETVEDKIPNSNEIDAEGKQRNDSTKKFDPIPEYFIRDYLHYFLVLPEDCEILKEFENAEYLYDVLRYFDIFEREAPEVAPELRDVQDRLFSIIFPGHDVFPRRPPNPVFPMTMTSEKRIDNYRINAINALAALLNVQRLAKGYTADIYSEHRVKLIIKTIENALNMEIQRLRLGISDLSISDVDAKLCVVDDAYLATLSAALSLFNITDGVENIVDSIILLTLSSIKEMRPHYLVAIMINMANIHKLPKSIFQKFFTAVVKHIETQMLEDLVKRASDASSPPWMTFETAIRILNVLARYPGALNRRFMESFMNLYEDSISALDVAEVEEIKETPTEINKLLGVPESEDWVSVRQPKNEVTEGRQREQDELKLRIRREMNINAMEERIKHCVWSLMACLSWCNLTGKYKHVIKTLNMSSYMKNYRMNSVGAIAILETCSQSTEEERTLVERALVSLMEVKDALNDDKWLEVMDVYQAATLPSKEGDAPRLKVDRVFIRSMLNNFALMRHPKPYVLRKAVDILQRYLHYLSKEQGQELLRQMCDTACDYCFLDRHSLNAERLDFPIIEMAHILLVSALNNVRIDTAWKNFLEIIKMFKHALSLEEIRETLAALKAANYSGVKDTCDMLMTRTCDIIEVMPSADEHMICDIMELLLSLGVAPIKLLRWYLYLKFHDIPESDMDRLSIDLVRGRKAYEVDFRGYKRPVGDSVKRELIDPIDEMYIPLNMDKDKPVVPTENLKYVMLNQTPEPPPYSGKIKPKQGVTLPRDIAIRLTKIVRNLYDSGSHLSQADIKLIKVANVLPKELVSSSSDVVEKAE